MSLFLLVCVVLMELVKHRSLLVYHHLHRRRHHNPCQLTIVRTVVMGWRVKTCTTK